MSREIESSSDLRSLRLEVRRFLAEQIECGTFTPRPDCWGRFNREFSRSVASRGWVGMTIPKSYGGGGRSPVERWAVVEELIACGAPIGAHWIGERQIAPMIMKFGTEEQRQRILPKIVAAEVSFALGMSEPESGSDLASLRTRAKPAGYGWILNGSKIWSTNAHHAEHIVVLCRTSEAEDRHNGLSQLLVDTATPGLEIRPIEAITGETDFAEVFFDEVFVPADCVLGEPGHGWKQITTELAFERGGPDRYLSTFPLLDAFTDGVSPDDAQVCGTVGRLVSELASLRCLSLELLQTVENDADSGPKAAIAKDAGTEFERRVPDVLRATDEAGRRSTASKFGEYLQMATLSAPAITLRGGTTEILRGIVGRQLAPPSGS